MIRVKSGRPLVALFVRILPSTGIRVYRGRVKVLITFLFKCYSLQKATSLIYLVATLKALYVVTQQSIGGHRLQDITPLAARFARNGTGLPRKWIPVLDRQKIRAGDMPVMRFWLTLFSLYRILEIPGELKLQSITDPFPLGAEVLSPWSYFVSDFWRIKMRRIPGFNKTWFGKSLNKPGQKLKDLVAVPFLISKSSPSVRAAKDQPSPISTSPAGVIYAARAWLETKRLTVGQQSYNWLENWCKLTGNQSVLNRIEAFSSLAPLCLTTLVKGTPQIGKLGFKDEPAGKIRVFAMVDPFTQWLMKPLWDRICEVLRLLPQDGTFDQYRPLERLNQTLGVKTPRFCFDLSSATDRLPVLLQCQLLAPILGLWAAQCWMYVLIGRPYLANVDYGKDVEYPRMLPIYYQVGQPMGALTSWGMLALTHHAIVQWAAERAGITSKGVWFEDYAILGDDLVIANQAVADEYLKIMKEIGVGINLSKSLISLKGKVVEFAKRTLYNGVNISPVPLKEIYASIQSTQAAVTFGIKYQLTPAQYLALFGARYRVLGQLHRPFFKLGTTWRKLLLSYISPSGVNPRTWGEFFRSKGLYSYWGSTSTRMQALHANFYQHLQQLILESIDRIQGDLDVVKKLIEVRRDREYYSRNPVATPIAQGSDRQIRFEGLKDTVDLGHQAVLEDLKNYVYRIPFMDVLVDIRNIREACEQPMDTMEEFEAMANRLEKLYEDLSLLPLPKQLYSRIDTEVKSIKEAVALSLWHSFSVSFRRSRAPVVRSDK